jgi:putative ABC transport system ATP-binding protein
MGEITMTAILRTEKLCKTFSNDGMQQHVIKNLDLSIESGDFTVIMGASGSGKSTLLYALSGMDKPSMGKVFFGEEDISSYSNDQLAMFRRKNCGFVFQSIYLLENMNVIDNILTGALVVQKNSPALISRVKTLLGRVGIGEDLWKKYPNQLSGGECQRVGIVRAVVNEPRVLFADEPTGALDSSSGQAVLDVFTSLHKDGQSIVMVTHDIKTALRGNRVIYLRDGSVVGEYKMPLYGTDDVVARRDSLQAFLNEMGW